MLNRTNVGFATHALTKYAERKGFAYKSIEEAVQYELAHRYNAYVSLHCSKGMKEAIRLVSIFGDKHSDVTSALLRFLGMRYAMAVLAEKEALANPPLTYTGNEVEELSV